MWTWLKGKKTYIGMGLVLVGQLVKIYEPELGEWIEKAGLLIGGVGIADKAQREARAEIKRNRETPKL